jgi:hypothetical protein
LGEGSLLTRLVPVRFIGLESATPVAAGRSFAISAGTEDAVAVDDEGHVWGWGTTGSGQLGQSDYSFTAGVGALAGALYRRRGDGGGGDVRHARPQVRRHALAQQRGSAAIAEAGG